MSDQPDFVARYGWAMERAKLKYSNLYDEHSGHDCEGEGCNKWEVDRIQERYSFILEMTRIGYLLHGEKK